MEINIRAFEPNDYESIAHIHSAKRAFSGTLQLPYPSKEYWRERLENKGENDHILVAESGNKVIGNILLKVNQNPR